MTTRPAAPSRIGTRLRQAADERTLIHELEPEMERLVERHLSTCKEWYPHEFVPWSLGRDFQRDEGWDPAEVPMPDEVRSALFVNLLTEDNLPYYFRTLERMFGNKGVWRDWSHRWVAEEGRHAQALRDFALTTRALDPRALEDGRMAQMSGGMVPEPPTAVDGFVYVALQELATRIAHRNTARSMQDALGDHPAAAPGYELLSRVATDENFHFIFYRDLTTAALEISPSLVIEAIERQVRTFEMPGTGIPGFKQHAEAIARAEIYSLAQHHDQILQPVVMKWWRIEALQGLSAEAEQARERLLAQVTRIGQVAARLADRARAAAERARDLARDRVGDLQRPRSAGS
ncbi:MAG: acyl-ACP desaturase [Ilumatobacteraceae bacterium]